MKKVFILGILFIVQFTGCATSNTFQSLIHQLNKTDLRYVKSVRNKLAKSDSTSFLNIDIADTLFVLESYDAFWATLRGRIWDKTHVVSYVDSSINHKIRQRGFKITNKEYFNFSDFEINVVSHWDTSRIRREEKISGFGFDNATVCNAFRCYRKRRRWYIDKIGFNRFQDPEPQRSQR